MKRLQNEMMTTIGRRRLQSAQPIIIMRSRELFVLCYFLSLSSKESMSSWLSRPCRVMLRTGFYCVRCFLRPAEYLKIKSLMKLNKTYPNLIMYLAQTQYSISLLQFLEQQSVFRNGSIIQKKMGAMSSMPSRQKNRKLWVQERASQSLGGFLMQTRKSMILSVAKQRSRSIITKKRRQAKK